MPTKEQIGMEKISPSALDCYEQCPRLFYYSNWLGLKLEEDKRHMDFGTAIHYALEILYSKYDDNFGGAWEAADFNDVKKAFLSKWKDIHITEESFKKFLKTVEGKESGFTEKIQLYDYMKADGIAILKSYWSEKERLIIEYNHDLTEFEVPIKMEFINPANPEEKLPILFSMRLDAKNRDASKIVDFKTSKGKYNEDETRKKIQGQCYVFATGIKKMDYTVLRKGLKSPDRIQVVQLEYDDADMASFYQRVRSILVKIAQREFSRPLMGHQRWCRCFDYEEKLSVN